MNIKQLKDILKNIDDDLIVVTENVQDGINRHNEIVGYENDLADEFFVIKIDNERHKEAKLFANHLVEYLDSKAYLSEAEEELLLKAQEFND